MSLLHHSQALAKCNGTLVFRRGSYIEEVLDVLLASGAQGVYFNRQLEPWYHQRDLDLESTLTELGYSVRSFKGMVLQREPWEHLEKARPAPHMLTKYQGSPNQADSKAEHIEQPSPSADDQRVELPLPAVTQIGITSAPCLAGLSLVDLGYGLSAGKGIPPGSNMPQHNKMREEKISRGIVKLDSEND
jgi:deoxyribodipyrimidine photolyase